MTGRLPTSCGTGYQPVIRRHGLVARATVLLILVCAASRISAAVALSLPLQGHYRAGRFIPIHVVATGENTLTLEAFGSVPTQLRLAGGKFDGFIPLLAAGTLREPHWTDSQGSRYPIEGLRPLADDERLVGIVGEAPDATSLFPEQRLVPVPIDRVETLLPAIAWEALDGLVLDASSAARLTDDQRSTFLAGGTVIAVPSVQPPDRRWPWVRQGEFWVLRHEVAGPTAAIAPEAYLPVEGERPGWPATFRRQVILVAVAFSILAIAITLWRSRWMIVAFVGLCAVTTGALAWWLHRQSVVVSRSAAVCVRGPGLTQCDQWRWESAIRPASSSFTSPVPTRPVLASQKQIEQTGMRLVLQNNSSWSFEFRLDDGASIAFVARTVSTQPYLPRPQPLRGWLTDFAQQVYAGPQDRVLGEGVATTAEGEEIPVVVIDRRPQ